MFEKSYLFLILILCMKEFVGSLSGVGFYQPTLSDSEAFRFTILGKMNGSFFVPTQTVTVAVTLAVTLP